MGEVLSALRRRPTWVAAALVAAVFAGVYGIGYAGYVGYDSLWALIWGNDIAHLHSPALEGVYAPTPHPLLNLVSVLLAPLGTDAGREALELLSLAAMVLLTVAAYRLGKALFSAAAGVVFAAILVTRPDIVELALYASPDVPFLALVLLAAAFEAERPRRGTAPLVALALAGLLRPEAWLLSLAYATYGRAWRAPRRAVLAVAAPLLWGLHDLVLTGDPLASFHGTRAVAERSQPGNGIGGALRVAPDYVNEVVGVAVFCCGVAAWLLVTRRAQERVALPTALLGLTFVPFLVYGAAGLTLYPRFLLPAAAMLALLAAAAAAGWAGRLAQAAVAIALVVSLAFTAGDLAGVRSGSETRAGLEADLLALVNHNRAVVDRCRAVHVPTFRVVPLLLPKLHVPKERYYRRLFEPDPGTLEVSVPAGAARRYVVDPLRADRVERQDRATTRGLKPLASSRDWQLSSNC